MREAKDLKAPWLRGSLRAAQASSTAALSIPITYRALFA